MFFTAQGKAMQPLVPPQCIKCPDPSIFTTSCILADSYGNYTCEGQGTDPSGNTWKGNTESGQTGEKIPATVVSCDTSGKNCYIKNLGTKYSSVVYGPATMCLYTLDSDKTISFKPELKTSSTCQKPDNTYCDPSK